MGVSYQILNGIAEIQINGVCSPEDLFGGFQDLLGDSSINNDTHILINVGESETLPPALAIEKIAQIIGSRKKLFSGRVSIYVTQQVRFGLARQLSTYLDSFAIVAHPFYEYQPAVDWLMSDNGAESTG